MSGISVGLNQLTWGSGTPRTNTHSWMITLLGRPPVRPRGGGTIETLRRWGYQYRSHEPPARRRHSGATPPEADGIQLPKLGRWTSGAHPRHQPSSPPPFWSRMRHPRAHQSRREAEKMPRFIREGSMQRVKKAHLLTGGADIDCEGSYLDCVRLVLAAEGGLVTMVEFLLERGTNINVAVPRHVPAAVPTTAYVPRLWLSLGQTASCTAASHRKLDVLRLLLRWGGDPTVADSRGCTPLHSACNCEVKADATKMATALLEAQLGWLPIHVGGQRNRNDLLDMLLLNAPSTLHGLSSQGTTPLCSAAVNGTQRMVQHLLRPGATSWHQPNIPNAH